MTGTTAAHGGRHVIDPLAITRRRRRALTLATKLRQVSRLYREFGEILAAPIDSLQDEVKRADRDLVLASIQDGAWTINALRAETHLTYPKLRPILRSLLAENLIISGRLKRDDPRGGQPEMFFRPR